MPITTKASKADLFASGARTLVNPVNAVGTSGAGLAKAFAQRFPVPQRSYKRWCSHTLARPGVLHVVRADDLFIVYFCTKGHWKDPSKIEWVEQGLSRLRPLIEHEVLPAPIAIPALGCGLGGLPWKRVRTLTEEILGTLPQEIYLFEPH
jgi:O-acetyl-ADP-ribose deacetylase (regulator of RNase III)